MPYYEKGDVRIRYEEAGSGFPLLVTPGGGLNSRVSIWPTAVFNAMETFSDEFRCIAMDQRNANGGESSGPVPADDPWGAFAADQLGLMAWREPAARFASTLQQVREFLRAHRPASAAR